MRALLGMLLLLSVGCTSMQVTQTCQPTGDGYQRCVTVAVMESEPVCHGSCAKAK